MIAIESQYATIGRELADALQDVAYSRKEDDRKRISALQTQLVALKKREDAEAAIKVDE